MAKGKSRALALAQAHVALLVAETEFLRAAGWAPVAPIVLGAPVWWIDPELADEQRQDVAVATQKARQVDVERGRR